MISLKLKYKKLVLFISVGTICIGGIAYTIWSNNKGDKANNSKTKIEVSVTDDSFTSQSYKTDQGEVIIEKNAYPEVNDLVAQYFDARTKADMDKLGTLVSNIENINKDDLIELQDYIEEYQNIDCFTAKGFLDGSYIILVRSDLKLKGIDTLAPGLTGLTAKKDEHGNLVIYNGLDSEEESAYKQSVYNCQGVKELIDDTETKYKAALESDEDLSNMYAEIQKEAEEKAKAEANLEDLQPSDESGQTADESKNTDKSDDEKAATDKAE